MKTRADAAPGEYARRGGRPGLAGRTGRAAHARGAGGGRALSRARVDPVGARAAERAPPVGEALGRGLALTHGAGAPCFGVAGGPGATARFGSLRLLQRAHRGLAGVLRRAAPAPAGEDRPRTGRARGLRAMAAAEGVCERLHELAGPSRAAGPPARRPVVGQRDGRPPGSPLADRPVRLRRAPRDRSGDAACCSARPPQALFAAYEEVAPLADGWRERVELYQLLPLLVHAVLFGGSYAGAAERAARRYAG